MYFFLVQFWKEYYIATFANGLLKISKLSLRNEK